MRSRRGIVAVLLMAAVAFTATLVRPQVARADAPAYKAVASVTGYGKVTVKYDIAEIVLGVSELKPTAAAAYGAMAASMNSITQALKASGVKDDEMHTGVFNLKTEYKESKFEGYRATNTVTITTERMDKAADFIQTAVSAGSNEIRGIRFRVKESDTVLNEALDLAMDDAKAKAERVAKRLGMTVSGVGYIEVRDSGRYPIYYDSYGSGGFYKPGSDSAPVFSGTTEFTATVSVRFELN